MLKGMVMPGHWVEKKWSLEVKREKLEPRQGEVEDPGARGPWCRSSCHRGERKRQGKPKCELHEENFALISALSPGCLQCLTLQ